MAITMSTVTATTLETTTTEMNSGDRVVYEPVDVRFAAELVLTLGDAVVVGVWVIDDVIDDVLEIVGDVLVVAAAVASRSRW